MQKYKESLTWPNLFYTPDGMKAVRVFLSVVYSLLVEGVDTYETGGVNNAAVTHADAHMDDTAVGVLEESEVVALHVAKAHLVATGILLRSIARQPHPHGFETDLREARTVDAAPRTTAP